MSTNPVPEAPSPTFEELMVIVSEAVRKAVVKEQEPERLSFSKLEEPIETYIRETEASGITFPPAILWEFRQALQVLKDAPRQLEAQKDKPRVHQAVAYLLYRNYEHLRSSVGADEAAKIISDFANGLSRKSRGRPLELPLATLVKAKQLRDSGKSYAAIGIQVKLTGPQVRTALRHHYGEKKSD